MLKKPSCLLALIFVSGVGQAGISCADGPPFIAHLPQGTVELVGVTGDYRPTSQSLWWRPDGVAGPIGSFYAVQKYHSRRPIADDKVRTFLVRIQDLPADASRDPVAGVNSATTAKRGAPTWIAGEGSSAENPAERFTGSPAWSVGGPSGEADAPSRYQGFYPGSHLWEETTVYNMLVARRADGPSPREYRDPSLRPSDYYQAFAAVFAGSAKTTDLRVGVSLGEWETVVARRPDSAGRASFTRDGREWTVMFGGATTRRNAKAEYMTRVAVTSTPLHTYGQWKTRLVAVASDGSEHASWIGEADGSGATMDGNSGVAVFRALPLSSIKEFRLQVRPFHCVEFDNISLRRGQKTAVRVLSAKASDRDANDTSRRGSNTEGGER